MTKNILLWKTIGQEQGNFTKLLTENYFYWSKDSKFSSLNIGDFIFIIDIKSATFLFASFAGDSGLKVENDIATNLTTVSDKDNDEIVEAEGTRWKEFIKFKIIQRIDINSKDWLNSFKYQSTNGTLYLFKNDPNKKTGVNDFIPSKTVKSGEVPKKLLELDLNPEAEEIIKYCIEYSKNFSNTDNEVAVKTEKKMPPIVKSSLSVKEILLSASQYIKLSGFKYHFEEIANFYLCLRAKPFVILAGISGTGKTQLPRKFGESLGFDMEEQIIQVPVRPDWTDGSELLGYTSLDNIFSPKDLTLAIQKAILNPYKPYFFILDEMNLARVEHYFSDYLSIIETRRRDEKNNIITDKILREEMLVGATNSGIFKNLRLPQNLYLIGTVNMDETTHSFSRKVLDRANSIEMNDIDLNWMEGDKKNIEKLQNISNDIFYATFVSSIDILKEHKESIKSEIKMLIDVNHILEKADLHFAYRVRDEVAFYLLLNKEHKLIDDEVAFDFQLVQKVLPRIHGSSERVQKVLIELLYLLEKGKNENVRTDIEFSDIEKQFPVELLKYKRSSKKILFMLKRFDEDRFTSFWL